MSSWLQNPIKGVLLDITGVLYESGEGLGTVIPGSVNAVQRLKDAGIPVRLVTNETCATRAKLVEKLQSHGYSVGEADIFSPVPAIVAILKERGLSPHLLVHPDIESEFSSLMKGKPTCVVMADADESFSFANMNKAFTTLMDMEKPTLFSLGYGKYYKHKGGLQLDVGAFANALEFACDIKSEIVGKPSPQFFGAALQDMGVTSDEAVMIGDDITSDVGGSQKCGLRGVLVRTGKYTPKCENHPTVKPDFIADNLAQAVEKIIGAQEADERERSSAILQLLVTTERITAVLETDQGSSAQLVSWHIENLTKTGDNAMSLVKCIKVEFVKEGKVNNVSYVVKVNPDTAEFQDVNELVAEKEIAFYTEILPELNRELTAAGDAALRVPRCFHVDSKTGKQTIYLEDLRQMGFRSFDRMEGLDTSHTMLVIQELARLHVSSFLFQRKIKGDLVDRYKFLTTDWTQFVEVGNGGFSLVMAGNFDVIIAMLNHIGGYEKAVNWIKMNKFRTLEMLGEMLSSSPPFDVICHLDCWSSNTLFRYDIEGNPVEVTLIDFQNIYRASLAVDLNYFLYTSLFGPERTSNIEVFLRTYFETFQKLVEAKGISIPFSFEELRQEYRNRHVFGLVLSLVYVPYITIDACHYIEFPDVFSVKSPERIAWMSQRWVQLLESTPRLRPRFLAIVDEMEAAGVFD